jgi:hypothetical protein
MIELQRLIQRLPIASFPDQNKDRSDCKFDSASFHCFLPDQQESIGLQIQFNVTPVLLSKSSNVRFVPSASFLTKEH